MRCNSVASNKKLLKPQNASFFEQKKREIGDIPLFHVLKKAKIVKMVTFPNFTFLCVFEFEEVAGEHPAVFTAQVHCSTLAVSPRLTFAALIGLHPFAVAVRFEAVLPDIPEIIGMDITLIVVTAYAEAA